MWVTTPTEEALNFEARIQRKPCPEVKDPFCLSTPKEVVNWEIKEEGDFSTDFKRDVDQQIEIRSLLEDLLRFHKKDPATRSKSPSTKFTLRLTSAMELFTNYPKQRYNAVPFPAMEDLPGLIETLKHHHKSQTGRSATPISDGYNSTFVQRLFRLRRLTAEDFKEAFTKYLK